MSEDDDLYFRIGQIEQLRPVVEQLSVWGTRKKYWHSVSNELRVLAELVLQVPVVIETDEDFENLKVLEGFADLWLEDADNTALLYEADRLLRYGDNEPTAVSTCPVCDSGDISALEAKLCNNCGIQYDHDCDSVAEDQEDLEPEEKFAGNLFHKLAGFNKLFRSLEANGITYNDLCYNSAGDTESAAAFINTLNTVVAFLNNLSIETSRMIANYEREQRGGEGP